MYTQALIPVENAKSFGDLKKAIDTAFSDERFFKSASRKSIRIRNWDGILQAGLLGKEAAGLYASLGDSDKGQIREHYLKQVEQVRPEWRKKFLKIFSYY